MRRGSPDDVDPWLGPRPVSLQGLPAVRVAACPMCGSFRRRPAGHGYARCRTCSTVYADPRLAEDVVVRRLDEFAPDPSAVGDDRTALDAEAWKRDLVEVVDAPGRRLLDVGTGSGAFPAAMKEAGWEAEGQDLSPAVAAAAAARFAVTVHTAPVDALTSGPYDVLTMWDMLEHAVSPPAMLRDCARLLAPGGVLVLLSPHSAGVSARLLGRRWWVYGPTDHIVLFSVGALERALLDAGFTVEALGTRQLAPPLPPESASPERPVMRAHARVAGSDRLQSGLARRGLGDWIYAVARVRQSVPDRVSR